MSSRDISDEFLIKNMKIFYPNITFVTENIFKQVFFFLLF